MSSSENVSRPAWWPTKEQKERADKACADAQAATEPQPSAEMRERYNRDQSRIHTFRHAASALATVLESEECMADAQEYIGAKLKLERRAESLEAVWN